MQAPQRPSILLVTLDTKGPEAAFVRDRLTEMGYEVKVNDPYKGVELVRAYSDPRAGRHSLQVEIAKRLYMNEDTLERNAGFSKLQSDLRDLLVSLREHLRG